MTVEAPAPIFLVGSMRSGSTLLRLILDSHPRIAVPSETGFMGGLAATKRIPEWKFGEDWYQRLGWTEHELDERLREFYGGMLRRYAEGQGKPRWGEKTPFHTAHMAQIAQVFPDALLVGIVRHPGAVAVSLHRRFHYGFAEAVQYWADTNRDMLRAGIALGDRFALLRYEDLLHAQEPVLREVLDFVREPWAPEVVEHHRVQRDKGAPRAAEGSTITSDPVDARRADAWADSIGRTDLRELDEVNELASFLGYEARTPGRPRSWSESAAGLTWLVTGTDLLRRKRSWPVTVSLDVDRRARLLDASAEELAARLARAEAALARTRSRRVVRVADALRQVQHGRSLADVRAAWRVLRAAVSGPGR